MKRRYLLSKYKPLLNSKENFKEITPNMKNFNVIGENFKELLNYLFSNCNVISFSNAYVYEDIYTRKLKDKKDFNKFSKDIEKYHIKTFDTPYWHCYFAYLNENEEYEGYIQVSLYKATEELKNIILEYTDNLFFEILSNEYNRYIVNPKTLEDICFFKNDELLLGTSSMSKSCSIYPNTAKELNFFKNLFEKDSYSLITPREIWDKRNDYICLKDFL
ncbi:MAG: hypothetical protein FWF57_00215 [Defluviitaleaceae bacterium]|nr:hypothetical protein [Defluviitaleaceae bacterium]